MRIENPIRLYKSEELFISDLLELKEDNIGQHIVLHATLNIIRLHIPREIKFVTLTNIDLFIPQEDAVNVIACIPKNQNYLDLLIPSIKTIIYVW